MAAWYVRSAAAGAGTGADWTNAKTTLAAAFTSASAGDVIYVSEDHAETQATALTLTSPGTASNPCLIFCVNHAGSVPPVTADLVSTPSGSISVSGNAALTLSGGAYAWGLQFVNSSASGTSAGVQFANGNNFLDWFLERCLIKHSTANNVAIVVGEAGAFSVGASLILKDCQVSFACTFQSPIFWINACALRVIGNALGAFLAAGSQTPSTLLGNGGSSVQKPVLFEGVDLSQITGTLVGQATYFAPVIFANCKLGSGVAGVSGTNAGRGSVTVDLHNCDSGAKNYRQEYYRYQGSVVQETTIVRSSGASDGTTPLSWKAVTNANPTFTNPLELPIVPQWIDTTGSHTVTIELINDGTTLNNDDIWLELEYLGSSLTPIASFDLSTRKADPLPSTSNAAVAPSAATWTTTGLTTPIKQKLSATVTVNMKGYVKAVVKIAKPSKTIYIDPLLAVT